jgi:hypothetical protein
LAAVLVFKSPFNQEVKMQHVMQPDEDPGEAFEGEDGQMQVQPDVGVIFTVSVIKGEDSLM